MDNSSSEKAVVHISGTLLRRAWHGADLNSCIVVRPGGEERDTAAYVVNQVKFDGPAEMMFDAQPRRSDRSESDTCHPGPISSDHPAFAHWKPAGRNEGFVGALPGFDNAIMVYLQADNSSIHVQLNPGDDYVPFDEFLKQVNENRIDAPVLDPRIETNCIDAELHFDTHPNER